MSLFKKPMVNYDVMIDNEGHYVRMSLQEIIDSGRETVRIRSMRGHYFEILVDTLVQTDREETARRRNEYFARQRRERREDPDYEPRTGRYHQLPQIIHHDELPPVEQLIPRRNPRRKARSLEEALDRGLDSFEISVEPPKLIPRIDDDFKFPVDDDIPQVPEPQLRNEEAENWRKLAIKNAEALEMASEEIKDLQEMLKDRDRKIVLGMVQLMKLAKQVQK